MPEIPAPQVPGDTLWPSIPTQEQAWAIPTQKQVWSSSNLSSSSLIMTPHLSSSSPIKAHLALLPSYALPHLLKATSSLVLQFPSGQVCASLHTSYTHSLSTDEHNRDLLPLAIGHLLQTEHLRYEKLTQTQSCPWLGMGQSLLTPCQDPSTEVAAS
uniref:Uncharacterized protein n=1 Tax=Molossus molossus TaxID=27622 RepID=A0A7J8IZC3_MOLMO|nr:hypothetical protein HJG59_010356 [Molossus molossus]